MKLLDHEVNWLSDGRRLFAEHRAYVWLLLTTAVLDVLSTIAFMSVVGVGHEYNWIVRVAALQLGIALGPFLGKSVQLAAVWVFSVIAPRLVRFVCTTVILLNLFAFMVNMRVFILNW